MCSCSFSIFSRFTLAWSLYGRWNFETRAFFWNVFVVLASSVYGVPLLTYFHRFPSGWASVLDWFTPMHHTQHIFTPSVCCRFR